MELYKGQHIQVEKTGEKEMTESIDNCKGCYYETQTCVVSLSNIYSHSCGYDSSKCPCRICLIKMMCMRRCEEFNTYFLEDSKRRKGEIIRRYDNDLL